MDWIDDTLAEFGRQLGVPDLRLNTRGAVRLVLGSGLHLSIEPLFRRGQQEVLLALGCPIGHGATQYAAYALQQAHAENFPPLDLQLSLSGYGEDTLLIASVRLSARAFTLQALSGAVSSLGNWLTGVTRAEAAHG